MKTFEDGLYSRLEDFLRDFGDIIHTEDQSDNEQLQYELARALYWRSQVGFWDFDKAERIATVRHMHYAEIGRLLSKAAWENGYREKHLRVEK